MECDEAHELLRLLADGELTPGEEQAVAGHAGRCPRCTSELASVMRLRARVKAAGPHAPSREFASRLRAALDFEDAALSSHRPSGRWRRFAALAASHLLVAVLAAGALYAAAAGRRAEEHMSREIAAAHVRAMLTDQLVRVASSDMHTVKPWLAAKLPFSPEVRDFEADGFPLAGGRVDYIFDQPAAVLVYTRRAHTISVFSVPAERAGSLSFAGGEWRGYHIAQWRDASFVYRAASDLNLAEFRRFVALASAPSPD